MLGQFSTISIGLGAPTLSTSVYAPYDLTSNQTTSYTKSHSVYRNQINLEKNKDLKGKSSYGWDFNNNDVIGVQGGG